MKKNILFVCTGNTCRSPMAEALFGKLLKQEGYSDEYASSSAGIYAYEGDGASPVARQAILGHGLDLSKHYARTLDDDQIQKAYAIFTMTKDHKRMILEVYPKATDKVFTLKEYAGYDKEDWDIADPFGHDIETYKACAAEINEVLSKILDRF
jgi:protein-tyrosine phosphatase